MNLDSTAIVAIAAVFSALVTLFSNVLTPRAKAVQAAAEGNTNVRVREAENEAEALKAMSDLLKRESARVDRLQTVNAELQKALLANNKTVTDFLDGFMRMLEKQTILLEKYIIHLERNKLP